MRFCRKLDHQVDSCPARTNKSSRAVRLNAIQTPLPTAQLSLSIPSLYSNNIHLSKTTRDQRPWRLHHVHVLCGLSPDSSLPATLLVDTGAETDFISSSFCQRAAIPIHRMLKSQTVSLAINSTLVLDSEANVTFFCLRLLK